LRKARGDGAEADFSKKGNSTRFAARVRRAANDLSLASRFGMIRKLKSGQFRLYSRKKDDTTGKRKNLGTFDTLEKAKQHEREVQYFKKH
jgi:hypothetical protein